MNPFNRREFLERGAILSAAAAAGVGVNNASAAAAEKAALAAKGGANDRLNVAVVGVNGRGMSHVGGFLGKNNCVITTVCDADEGVIGKAMDSITKVQGEAPKYVQDFRKLLDDKSIDIISCATPNHWHALMAVWGMRAGKNVYVEKPATHNVHEGRIMAETMAKTGKVCQVGTQSRSNPGMREAIAFIHAGKIGKVDLAYGTCYKPRGSIGKVAEATAPPKTMNYDLWSGPAAMMPVMRKRLHYDWHWIWEYGNGDFGNQGVHEVDKARWGLGVSMPSSVVTVGGRFGYVDDGETPNTELALYNYGDKNIIFEVRGLKTDDLHGAKVGNIWFGSEGMVVCANYGGGTAFDKDGKKIAEFKGGGDQYHFDNFVKAIRESKPSLLNCPAEEGHFSAALCHLANISYRLGKEATMDKADAAMAGDKAATEALARMKAHLTANGVDLKEAIGRVGPKLTIDTKTEKFTATTAGDLAKANAMLFREYRKGFEISETA